MSFHSCCPTEAAVPLAAHPSRKRSLREAISLWIFLPIALRRSSASAGVKPASCLAISMNCSWYRHVPYVIPVIGFRPWPIQSDERDQVLEHRRLHLPQRLAHPGRLELEHARRLALREHLVHLLVVERQLPVGE